MKVLFIDSVHNILQNKLTNLGFICDYKPDIDSDNILEIIQKYDGLIIRSKITLDKKVLDKATNLKFIGRVGAGLENIDIEYAESLGITCFSAPEGNRDAVAEHALGMILSLFNNICRANSQVKRGEWKREFNRGIEIKGKTIGIIGYGNMGSAFAKRLKGFDCKTISYDKYKYNYSDEYTIESSLDSLFEQTDILSLHVPLTNETEFMINYEFLNKFRKPIYLINTSRGKVLKTDELVKAMKEKKVLGVALDVLEYEKKSFEKLHDANETPKSLEYLIENDNVLLSPHIAGWTQESNVKLSETIADKILIKFSSYTFNDTIIQ